MKSLISLLAIFILALSSLIAKPVDSHTAKIVGGNFLKYKTGLSAAQSDINLTLVYTSTSTLTDPSMAEPVACFYVFNFANGFVIVSGDDVVRPVLGYSHERSFRTENMAEAVAKWLEGYKSQIRYAIMHDLQPDQEIINAWAELKGGDLEFQEHQNRSSVPALVQTQWDQPAPYNELCPGGSVTGCVATAMAQIMKYWNYPEKGQGFHSFNHENYGTVSANFGSTTYQWGSMPNSIVSSNNAIATLMYHCGVSVDMGYTPEVSGAWVIENSPTPGACSEYAFKTYFGYDNSLQGIERVNYSDAQWETVLKTELDASRPVMYDGFGNGGGHAFVCDGYDTNDFFHFNWGWSGYYDGYFETSALNPGGTGTGGGTGGYNSGQQAIIGIKPPGGGGTTSYTLNLYGNLNASSTNIYYGQGFSVETNIWNAGTTNFSGDYSAVVFDYNYNFVEFMEIKTNWTLDAGYVYTDGISFSTSGLLSMLPGTYYVAVFFRPTGGEWSIVGDGDYLNLVQIDVTNANAIELYSAMSISPGTTLTQGSPASVNLNILNNGVFTFEGTYSVDLYDLNGDWVENIGQFTESNGLPAGYLYLEPYLTFATPSVEAEPGTYLVAVTHQWS